LFCGEISRDDDPRGTVGAGRHCPGPNGFHGFAVILRSDGEAS
jgi:hypothetical protein